MSNQTPQAQTGTTVTVSLAITVVVSLLVLAVLLFTIAVNLFQRGDAQSDLLYTIAGVLTLAMALIPTGFLFEVIYSLIFERTRD